MVRQPNSVYYRGVSCSRCREPIPVSARVIGLQHEVGAFTLRCKVCMGESVYAVTEIQDFEGEPRSRRSASYQNSLRSRAANG
jgi:hypothetical protein